MLRLSLGAPCVTELMPSPETYNLARRLLDYEASTAKNLESSAPAVVRLSEKLRRHLCAIAGIDTYRLLVSRALKLGAADAPSLSQVQVTAEGSLQGLVALKPFNDKDRAGIVLITQLLELFLAFLGVPLMLRLLHDVCPDLEVAAGSNASRPFENVLREVDELTKVSKRLESLANQHPSVEEALLIISGSVRSSATLLEVLALIKNKKDTLPEDMTPQPTKRYVM